MSNAPIDRLLDRPLPHSAETERTILGSVILDNRLVHQAFGLLRAEHFCVRGHQLIFRAMIDLSARGAEINPVTLGEELKREGLLEQVGGSPALSNLTDGLPPVTDLAYYGKIVRDKSLLRQLIKASNKITSEALEDEDEAQLILGRAEQMIAGLRGGEIGAQREYGPRIVVNDRQLRDTSSDAIRALAAANDPPETFVRGGVLARLRTDEHGSPTVQSLTASQLRARLTEVMDFVKIKKDSDEEVSPPTDVVENILAQGSWPFPTLEGPTEIPLLRPDGTILDQPGYDPATRLVYMPGAGLKIPPIPTNPSDHDVAQARNLIDEMLWDFPFVDEGSRANAYGLMLTPVVRPAIKGKVLLAVIDAPKMGNGKGLLAEITAIIATGRAAENMKQPKDEAEWSKQITATLMGGATLIVIDDLSGPLSSASLSRALTSVYWKDRVLGHSRTVVLRQRAIWMATGNNIKLGGDIPRRCYQIRLDAKTSRPWQRQGFRIPNLREWVTERRGELLAALLTITRAWYTAGCPEGDAPVLGGFEDFTRTIGGMLKVAGVPGFLSNLPYLYEQSDEESPEWESFLVTWTDVFDDRPVTVKDLVEGFGQYINLRDALPGPLAEAFDGPSGSFRRKLGKALAKHVDVRYGDADLHLERAGEESRGGCVRWRVTGSQVTSGNPETAEADQFQAFSAYAGS